MINEKEISKTILLKQIKSLQEEVKSLREEINEMRDSFYTVLKSIGEENARRDFLLKEFSANGLASNK